MRHVLHITAMSMLLAAAIPLPAAAEDPDNRVELSLEAAVEKALSTSSRLEAGEAEVAARRAAKARAGTGRLPALDLEASYMRLNEREPAVIEMGPQSKTLGEAPENTYSLSLSLRQPLFTGGEIASRIDAVEHAVAAGRSRRQWMRSGVELEVRTAYWHLVEAEQRVRAIEERRRQVEENLANMERRRENGVVTRSKVLTVEMRLAEVKLQLLRARHGLELARSRLALLVGLPAGKPIIPATALPEEVELPKVVEGEGSAARRLIEQALRSRDDLAEERSALRAARAEERSARSGWFPQLFLAGEYTYARPNQQLFPAEDEFESTWRVGLIGRIELGAMPGVYHQSAEKDALREASAARLREAERQVRMAVQEAYLEWKSSGEELAVARTMVRQAKENLAETRTRVESGTALNEDLLEAQAVLLEARLSLTSAKTGRQIARDRLLRATGLEL